MAGLENFRQQYPQYNSVPDQELADKLHSKYYSSIPKDEYYQKLGISTQPVKPEESYAQSFLAAPRRLAVGVVSGLQDIGLGAFQTGAEAVSKLPEGEVMTKNRKETAKNMAGAVSDVYGKKLEAEKSFPENTESLPYKAGKFATKAAVGLAGGLIGGSALSAATEPKLEGEGGLANRAIDTAKMAATGRIFKEGLKLGAKAFDNVADMVSPKVSKEAVDQFKQADIKPTLGQVSDSNIIKYAEAGLEKFPGSAGVIQKAKQNALGKVQEQIRSVADATPLSKEGAGILIQEGAKKDVTRFKEVSNRVFKRLDRYVKADEPIAASNISQQIDKITQELPREAAARKLSQQGKAFELIDNLAKDIKNNGGNLDYKTAKFYRTQIGSEINQKHVIGDTDTGQLKQLYASLSQDMEGAFTSKGSEAQKAFKNANEFYAKGVQNIENKLTKIIQSHTPEKIYEAALGGTKEGPTRIRAIMKTLDPEERTLLRSTVLHQIGQNADKDFSAELFLKNYQKLEGKAALLSPEQIKSLDNLSKVLKNIKSVSSKTNTSNTATMQNLTALGAGGLVGGLTGAIAAGKVIGGAYITAKLFTSPKFINWLADTPKINTAEALSKHIDKLAIIASKNPEIQPDIQEYLKSIISEAQASDNEDLSEEEIRSQLQQEKQQYPGLSAKIDPAKRAREISKRYNKQG